jgi:hypothetical protein
MTSHQSAASMTEHSTGVKDAVYNIVSVLYHALHGRETCMQYLHDAQETRDHKLVQFFQEVQECHRYLATRAKEVLAQYLDHGNSHESHRSLGSGTQAHGMTASEPPSHDHQGTKVSPAQGREERQGRDREYKHRR